MSRDVIETSYTLSPMQQGMLFHSLAAEGSGIYVQQLVCRLQEDLNLDLFRQAWEQVVERHSILRTTFRWKDLEEPLQDVHTEIALPMEVREESGRSPEKGKALMEAFLEADRRQGFDLCESPPWRVMIFRFSGKTWQCVWTFHHILLDGRSHYLLLREIFSIYDAFRQGAVFQVESPRPYKEYINWITQQDPEVLKAFWQANLEGLMKPTCLGGEAVVHDVEAAQEEHGYREIRFSAERTLRLQRLASEQDVTLNTLVQGAWALLLSRHSGKEDVVFGSTRACRHWSTEGVDSMVRPFHQHPAFPGEGPT